MPRIRTVKPELFKHEDLFDAEIETGLPLRVAFVGLFTQCDREGRFEWRPRQLKTDILPYDQVDMERVLHALATRGFLVKYACVSGNQEKVFGAIPTFRKHQVINNKERESEIPEPTEKNIVISGLTNACPTRAPRDDDALATRTNLALSGKEGNKERNKERKGTTTARAREPATDEPEDVGVVDQIVEKAEPGKSKQPDVDPATRLIEMFDTELVSIFGEEQRRRWPANGDVDSARQIDKTANGDDAKIRHVMKSNMQRMHASGQPPPRSLKYFVTAIQSAMVPGIPNQFRREPDPNAAYRERKARRMADALQRDRDLIRRIEEIPEQSRIDTEQAALAAARKRLAEAEVATEVQKEVKATG